MLVQEQLTKSPFGFSTFQATQPTKLWIDTHIDITKLFQPSIQQIHSPKLNPHA
jgi:hypothetical protein